MHRVKPGAGRRESQIIGVFAADDSDPSTQTFLSLSSFKTILRQSPGTRSSPDISFLVKFTGNVKFFQTLSAEIHYQCCQYMRYSFVRQGEVVFRKGEPGTAFYVILDGVCSVSIPTYHSSIPIDQPTSLTYTAGDSFGELALLRNSNRTMTVKCKVDTHLAVLEREDFTRIIAVTTESALDAKVDFLSRFPFFSLISRSALQQASYFFREKTYRHRQVVYNTGDATDLLYFIQTGCFEVQIMLKKDSKLRYKADYMRKVSVAVLTKDQVFGEEEMIDGVGKRRYSVVCDSAEGLVLAISIDDFMKRVCTEAVYASFRIWQQAKNEFRSKRIVNLRLNSLRRSREKGEKERKFMSPELSPVSFRIGKSSFRGEIEGEKQLDSVIEKSLLGVDSVKASSRYVSGLSWDEILQRQYAKKGSRRLKLPAVNIHTRSKRKLKSPYPPSPSVSPEPCLHLITSLDSHLLRHAESHLYL